MLRVEERLFNREEHTSTGYPVISAQSWNHTYKKHTDWAGFSYVFVNRCILHIYISNYSNSQWISSWILERKEKYVQYFRGKKWRAKWCTETVGKNTKICENVPIC